MKIKFLLLFLLVFAACTTAAPEPTFPEDPTISDIEAYVSKLIAEKDNYELYHLNTVEEPESLEGAPPEVDFYYDVLEGLVAVRISVGHETWAKEFVYYFHKNQPVKYVDRTLYRPDEPPNLVNYYFESEELQVEIEPVLDPSVIMLEFLERDGFTEDEIFAMASTY